MITTAAERQRQSLKNLVEGHHKKTAARVMSISVNTVSFHLKNIYEKLLRRFVRF
ncbi:MAG: LuxR C-terminal-related transcriptional regulator [Pyrinomonadaceae bacterium]